MRRGRPKHHREKQDRGTPELQEKRRAGLTADPLDRLLEGGHISAEVHRSALHFRWLYTIARGLPCTAPLARVATGSSMRKDSPAWREAREGEYLRITLYYGDYRQWQCALNLCVFQQVSGSEAFCAAALHRLHDTLERVLSKGCGRP